jgi:hypothetical protein
MPSPGPGGSQSSLAGAVAWLTSQFRARPKPQPKKGAPIASYTMGTDPTALGGNACGSGTGSISPLTIWATSRSKTSLVRYAFTVLDRVPPARCANGPDGVHGAAAT